MRVIEFLFGDSALAQVARGMLSLTIITLSVVVYMSAVGDGLPTTPAQPAVEARAY